MRATSGTMLRPWCTCDARSVHAHQPPSPASPAPPREPPDAPRRRRTTARLAGLATAGAAVLLVAVRRNRTQALDLAVALRVQAARRPAVAKLMWAVSQPGFPPLNRVVPPLLVAIVWRSGHRLEAGLQVVAWGAALLAEALKAVVRRPRPLPPAIRVTVAALGGSSFPSGHVLTYAGVYGFGAYLAHTMVLRTWLRRSLTGAGLAMLALIGPSRVYLGHHWPTDVLASYLLGFAWLAGLAAVHRRLRGEAAA